MLKAHTTTFDPLMPPLADSLRTHALPLDNPALWRAVQERDRRYEGVVYYAVHTTGVYCRPTCPSRRPKRENVSFFFERAAARDAGFRACRRCKPDELATVTREEATVLAACRRIAQHDTRNPTLTELAAEADLSPGHLQKVFKRVLGITPKQYADALRMAELRDALARGENIAEATFDAGFGSSSRLYEKASSQLGMTPGAYKRGGKGQTIHYAIAPCSLGYVLVAATEKGLCAARLGDGARALASELRDEFSEATLTESSEGLSPLLDAVLAYLDGASPLPQLPLDVHATAFQARVWNALREIPDGHTMTYGELAATIGQPAAARAVGNAVAANPVAMAIPCHRVVPKGGGVGGYRWDPKRKRRLLEMERRRAGTAGRK